MSISTETPDIVGVQDRCLDAAEQIVARDGVSNLTLEAVAREAGVSKGGLLYHFPSKSALITAIVERLASRCDLEQNRQLSDSHTPGGFTRAYMRARAERSESQHRPLQTALIAAAGTDPHYLEPIRQRCVAWQSKIENDGIDPVIATIVRLAVDGMCLGKLLGFPVPAEELRQQVLDRLVSMTAAPKE